MRESHDNQSCSSPHAMLGAWTPHNGLRDLDALLSFVESFAPEVPAIDSERLESLREEAHGAHVAVAVRLPWHDDWDQHSLNFVRVFMSVHASA